MSRVESSVFVGGGIDVWTTDDEQPTVTLSMVDGGLFVRTFPHATLDVGTARELADCLNRWADTVDADADRPRGIVYGIHYPALETTVGYGTNLESRDFTLARARERGYYGPDQTPHHDAEPVSYTFTIVWETDLTARNAV